MLTPIEIQGKTFKNSGMGYSKADVDSFFSSVSADFEALYKENLSLKEKINNLDASLSHYKEIEKSLEQLHVKTTDLLQQYDRYRTQYKALASAQLDLLNSEAFDIDVATMKAISGLEESAAEHTDQLQAEPVYAVEETESEETAVEQEEDFDETLSTDDAMIKDFSEMFDSEKDEENQ